MQRSEVLAQLKDYVAQHLLDGTDIGLDESTPLLEWGVINSLEIIRLISFIEKQFGVEVPGEKIVASYFINLASLSNLVLEIADRRQEMSIER